MKLFLITLIIGGTIANLQGAGEQVSFLGEPKNADGSIFLRARAYDPDTGVFLSKDPFGISEGTDLYRYADANPVNFYDRNGLYIETAWDIANIGISAWSLKDNIKKAWNGDRGAIGWAVLDGVGLVYDVAATAVPLLPGGAGTLMKTFKGAKYAKEAVPTFLGSVKKFKQQGKHIRDAIKNGQPDLLTYGGKKCQDTNRFPSYNRRMVVDECGKWSSGEIGTDRRVLY